MRRKQQALAMRAAAEMLALRRLAAEKAQAQALLAVRKREEDRDAAARARDETFVAWSAALNQPAFVPGVVAGWSQALGASEAEVTATAAAEHDAARALARAEERRLHAASREDAAVDRAAALRRAWLRRRDDGVAERATEQHLQQARFR